MFHASVRRRAALAPRLLAGGWMAIAALVLGALPSHAVDEDPTILTNVPPRPFELLSPADGVLLSGLNPLFEWQVAVDPNPEDVVRYTLVYSRGPDFEPSRTTTLEGLLEPRFGSGALLAADQHYFWRVVAEDPHGATTTSTVFEFSTDSIQQVRDDFERDVLGPDWLADPGYAIHNGRLTCSTPGFDDIAIYAPIDDARSVAWAWSDDAFQMDLDAAGCVFMDAPHPGGNGYYVFRKTVGSQAWSVWEVEQGLLVGSLLIDTPGSNPIPEPGSRMRVTFTATPNGHVFDCFIDDRFDARLVDSHASSLAGGAVHGGMLLGQGWNNDVEEFVVLGSGANQPPQPFSLMAPGNGAFVFSLLPELAWDAAADPNPGDWLTYTVEIDRDPGFANPLALTPTADTALRVREHLVASVPYYWRVRAQDAAGEAVWSEQTWSFRLGQTLAEFDDFDRSTLGTAWAAAPGIGLIDGELANTAPGPEASLAIFGGMPSPDAVELRWGSGASADGIRRGGFALGMNAASPAASGYWARIDPLAGEAVLTHVVGGTEGVVITTAVGSGPAPEAGTSVRAVTSSDSDGNHVDLFVGGAFFARLSDPDKLEGTGTPTFSGVCLGGNGANNIDDFMAIGFVSGDAAGPFVLTHPAHADTGVALAHPILSWEASGGMGTVYTVYVASDSSGGAVDSVQVQTTTAYAWHTMLEPATEYVWRVRASDRQSSVFNDGGWHVFRTTSVTPVELARFDAAVELGRIVLDWEVAWQFDLLGFHVQRSLDRDGHYARLSTELIRSDGGRHYRFTDDTTERGRRYYYALEAVDRDGTSRRFGPVSAVAGSAPRPLALHQNFPNPFNPSTLIRFDLPAPSPVRLAVYDVHGRLVRELVAGVLPAGEHRFHWDARSQAGVEMASGVYLYRLEAGDGSLTRRMILVR